MPTDEKNLHHWRVDRDWIRWWCYTQNESAAGLGRKLNVERSTVARWKNGSRSMNEIKRAYFRKILGVTVARYAKGPHGQK